VTLKKVPPPQKIDLKKGLIKGALRPKGLKGLIRANRLNGLKGLIRANKG